MRSVLACSASLAVGVASGALTGASASSSSQWAVQSAKRTVYASGNVAQVDVKVSAKNTGAETREFIVTTAKKFGRPGHIVAYGSSVKNQLRVEGYNGTDPKTDTCKCSYKHYAVKFNKPIEAGKTVSFTYSMNLGVPFTPLPKTIHLYQRQFLQYFDTLYVPSVYPVESQVTNVELASSGTQVEQIEPTDVGAKTAKSSNTVKFGPFDEAVDFFEAKEKKNKTLMVHFSNQEHQTYFPTVRREIEVSHWGNVAFKEAYELKHAGAAVTSAFNRVGFSWGDYRKRGMQAPENPVSTAMYEMNVVLPRTARNIYYRDEIGNISSSNARRDDKGYVLAQIRPRYPVLGGWQADWEFTYDVPTRSALKSDPFDPTFYVLNVTMSPPIVRTYTRKMTVEVLLPEGATEIKLHVPSNKVVTREYRATRHSWLDFFGGRPTVGFEIDDFYVPEKQILQYKFQVTYRFAGSQMFHETVFLAVLLFLGFLTYIVVGRSNLRIARKGERKLLDMKEVCLSVSRANLDKFDVLVGEMEQTCKRADAHARLPVKHKWEPYLEMQLTKLKDMAEVLDRSLGEHKATYSDRTLYEGKDAGAKACEAARKLLKDYVEHQPKHLEARANPEATPKEVKDSKASGGGGRRASLVEQLETKADQLEADISEALRTLADL